MRSQPSRQEGFAIALEGAPIYYRIVGTDAPRENLVFTDGIGCDGYVWKYLERTLAPEHRIAHWHLPGHGRTPVFRSRRVSIPDLADDLAAVMDAAGMQDAVLFGHSMGVQVSLEAFRRHRKRVRALVLMCGSFGTPLRTFRGNALMETMLPYLAFAVRRAPRTVQSLWKSLVPTRTAFAIAQRFELNADLILPEDFMPYLEHIAEVDLNLFLEMLGHASRHSAREILPTIDVPTLVVSGSRDGFTPPDLSQEMNDQIPGAELLVVEGGSHTAPIERPQLVADRVGAFLERRLTR